MSDDVRKGPDSDAGDTNHPYRCGNCGEGVDLAGHECDKCRQATEMEYERRSVDTDADQFEAGGGA